MNYEEFATGKLLFLVVEMTFVLEILAVFALVATGMAIIVGALSPGDALRRVGAVLLLLLIVPVLITTLIQALVAPLLASLRAAAKDITNVLMTIAAIALFGWLALCLIHRYIANNHKKTRNE